MDLFVKSEFPKLALSWRQPFGTAMLFGKQETRRWDTAYRGKVLICTSKAPYNETAVRNICGEDNFIRMCLTMVDHPTLDLNGYAIAVGELIHTRPMILADQQKTFVKHYPDLFVHVYQNVVPIKPFPWKGAQRWKKVDGSVMEKIVYL